MMMPNLTALRRALGGVAFLLLLDFSYTSTMAPDGASPALSRSTALSCSSAPSCSTALSNQLALAERASGGAFADSATVTVPAEYAGGSESVWRTALRSFSLMGVAHADVVAPQAPPELSDTLTDFRTKEQLTQQTYIAGRMELQNSLEVPTVPGDFEAKVMRMSASYLPHYEIAVPRNGVSIIRFYDLNGYPMEIVSTKLENQGFIAEVTAAPSELLIRQFQGAATSLLQVRLKGVRNSFVFALKPLYLVNQQNSVRTLLTSMTVNYYVEGTNYLAPTPYQFDQPNPQAKVMNFEGVEPERLLQDLLQATAVVLPLNDIERTNNAQDNGH